MKRSKHLKDTYVRQTKKEYLEGVRGRLVNDVGTYFETIDRKIAEGKHIGYWGSARLIFPVIEAIAKTIYKKSSKEVEDNRVARLLEQLNIKYPNVVWQMYRNSLAHSDHLAHITKGKHNTITWSVGYNGTGHNFSVNRVHIDTRSLYNDLLNFLDTQITKSSTNVYVKNGLNVGRKYKGSLGKEVSSLTS